VAGTVLSWREGLRHKDAVVARCEVHDSSAFNVSTVNVEPLRLKAHRVQDRSIGSPSDCLGFEDFQNLRSNSGGSERFWDPQDVDE